MLDRQLGVEQVASILARNTEAIGVLQIRVQALEGALRQITALGLRALGVLGRSAKPDDLMEAAAIQAEVQRVLNDLMPRNSELR